MPWFKAYSTLKNDPKTARLARALGVPRTQAVGMMAFLWWWSMDHIEDGDLRRVDKRDIAREMDWPEDDAGRLWKALTDTGPPSARHPEGEPGFVDKTGKIHEFDKYFGALMRERERERQRKKAERDRARGASGGEAAGRSSVRPDVRRTSAGRPPDAKQAERAASSKKSRKNKSKPTEPATPPPAPVRAILEVLGSLKRARVDTEDPSLIAEIETWLRAYPDVDITKQLWEVDGWAIRKRVTRSSRGWRRTMATWFGKEQDRARPSWPKPTLGGRGAAQDAPDPMNPAYSEAEALDRRNRSERASEEAGGPF